MDIEPREIARRARRGSDSEGFVSTRVAWLLRVVVLVAGLGVGYASNNLLAGIGGAVAVVGLSLLLPKLKTLVRQALGTAVGDPRQAPSRIVRVFAFLFILGVIASVAIVLGQSAESAGESATSSYWLFNLLSTLIENPITIVGSALFLYFRAFGLRRNWASRQAAEKTGWLVETVKQLSDEVRSMKGSSFLIVSTGDTRAEIEDAVREALDASITGDPHDRERPDFYESLDDYVDVDPEHWIDRDDVQQAATDASNLATTLARSGDYQPRLPAALARDGAEESLRAGLGSTMSDDLREPDGDDAPQEDAVEGDSDDEVPWSVAVKEEIHSLWLSLSASISKGRIYWELGLPYIIAAWIQLVLAGFWVRPEVYLVVLGGTSPLFALGTFWVRQRVQDRRISRYRTPSTGSFWTDAGARVKVVRTDDITAYAGQTAGGRTYASYDRGEFVTEFSQRLWEMTTENESISPSILEQYARNLKQMKPNLHGHLQNVELPAIRGDIADCVSGSQDEVVTKSRLAYDVIEPSSSRMSNDLGHDPKLVSEVYRQKVEEIHSLSEVETSRETPDGREVTLTLVYPTTKTRLPDMTELHSRFSDRFMGAAGEPIYELPAVDPREDLSGHAVPYDTQTQIQTAGELPPVGAD